MDYILLEYVICCLAVLGSALLLFVSVLVLMLARRGVRHMLAARDMIPVMAVRTLRAQPRGREFLKIGVVTGSAAPGCVESVPCIRDQSC